MGALKLSYYNEVEPLDTFRKNFKVVYAKREVSEKNALNSSTFGSLMPGRHTGGNEYRYGFNGEESDPELKGEGNSINYKARIYDPRLGKFLSVDPLTKDYPWYTPYQFAGNTPIQAVDLDGLEPKYVNESGYNVSASDHTFNGNPLYDSPTLRETRQNEKAALTQSNNELKRANWGGTIRAGKSNYEKAWERTTPTWSQAWIKTDPVLKSVAVSGAVVTGVTLLPSLSTTINGAKKAYDGGQLLYMTIQGSEGAIGVGAGIGMGATEYLFNAPPDMPSSSNPIIQGTREMTNAGLQLIEKSVTEMKQNSKEKSINKETKVNDKD